MTNFVKKEEKYKCGDYENVPKDWLGSIIVCRQWGEGV
jgi:hypothetical protein